MLTYPSYVSFHSRGGGHWPRKGVWGCAALKTPFSRLSCRSQGSHFKQRVSSQDPFWENLEILALTASIFTQILAHKPPNLEIFSSQAPKFGNFQLTSPQIWKFSAHKPPFSEANVSSQAPHFGNPGRTPLPEKSWVPPGFPFITQAPTHMFDKNLNTFLFKENFNTSLYIMVITSRKDTWKHLQEHSDLAQTPCSKSKFKAYSVSLSTSQNTSIL